MTYRPVDLNKPLFIKAFIASLHEAAGTLQMDAHMLRESGQDARVWEIAWEELSHAAERIKARTADLPSVQRCDPPDPFDDIIAGPPVPAETAAPRLRLVRR
jgi:hypothetical protein